MKKVILFSLLVVLIVSGCGKTGPTGPVGPQGSPGVTLLKEYTGMTFSDGWITLSIPEITGKQTTTFVMAYWAYSDMPDQWFPMTDGWLDSVDYCHIFSVSWSSGEVMLFGMSAGDVYLLQVFQHN